MKIPFGPSVKLLLSALLIVLLMKTDLLEPATVARAFRNHPGYAALAVLTYFLLATISGIRWFVLIRAVGITMRFPRLFSLHMIGLFFSVLLPGGAGGDFIKGYYLYRRQPTGRRALALTSIAADRFIGIYGLVTVGVIVIAANFERVLSQSFLRASALFYCGIFLVATAAVVLLLGPWRTTLLDTIRRSRLPGQNALAALADSIDAYGNRKRQLAVAFALAVIVHGGLTLVFWLVLQALELNLSYRENAFVVPMLTLINGIPLSPAGIGSSEAAGEMLYRIGGLGQSGAEIVAVFHLCVAATALLGLPFYLLHGPAAEERSAR